ncbi:MAG: transglycosylase domain-containing protein [Egibacteraceae bacterium]
MSREREAARGAGAGTGHQGEGSGGAVSTWDDDDGFGPVLHGGPWGDDLDSERGSSGDDAEDEWAACWDARDRHGGAWGDARDDEWRAWGDDPEDEWGPQTVVSTRQPRATPGEWGPPARTPASKPARGRPPAHRKPRRPISPRRRRARWLRRVVLSLLVLPVVVLGVAGTVLFSFFVKSVPLPSAIGSKPTVILDSTGTVAFATLQPKFARQEVPLTQVCPPGRRYVCDAVLAAEDAGFYRHGGVSVPGIIRAALRNVTSGQVTQGGSTISQQYIKNVTGKDERTALRKVREAALAMKLEREYSKDQILELYLNSIYFGRGAYGIQAAAHAYFGIDASDLSLAQAAQLAGVIPAPSSYDPLENPEGAHRRYRYVLDRMLALGWVNSAQAGQLRATPPLPQRRGDVRAGDAPYFLDIVRRELETRLGDQIYTGLRVTTTLNLAVQRHAQEVYEQAFTPILPTGALVALDPATGGIVALVGGENYQTDQFNLALAPRQAGSTFKPFALAAWIEDRKSPESYFDAPAKLVLPEADDGGDWTVNNYRSAAFPPMSLRQATWRSVNTVYAQVADAVGPKATADIASRMMGLEDENRLRPLASLVLGTVEITPLKLAEAYNTFASGGIHRSAFAVIEARQGGKVVYRHEPDSKRVLTAQVANGVTDVLKGVVANGSGRRAQIGRPAAGKTGTTQEYGDAWFAGYVPQLTAVVWMGNRDNNQTMPGKPTGGELPAETWKGFMSAALEGVRAVDFSKADEDGLVVERASPTPTPEVTEEKCADGEVVRGIGGTPLGHGYAPDATRQGTQSGDGSKPRPSRGCVPAISPSASEQVTSEEPTEQTDAFIPAPNPAPRDNSAAQGHRRRGRDGGRNRDRDRGSLLFPMPW